MITETHTIDDALERFALISGPGSVEAGEACVMTAISWVAGESWSDRPPCSHPILASLAIQANDAPTTTPGRRAEILRAGETGLLDTWWIPTEVVLAAVARPAPGEGEGSQPESPVDACLRTLAGISAWKSMTPFARPDLRGADLGGANLRYAYLGDANLRGADLGGADLTGADLGGANLRYADLTGADLTGADLTGANLTGADLTGADLRGAYLRYAYLGDANLRGADLGGADLRDAKNLVLPEGWVIDEATGITHRVGEAP